VALIDTGKGQRARWMDDFANIRVMVNFNSLGDATAAVSHGLPFFQISPMASILKEDKLPGTMGPSSA